MKQIEINDADIKLFEEALTGWQTTGISIANGERGELPKPVKDEWMSDELKPASQVLGRVDLTTMDLNLALQGSTSVREIGDENKLETLRELGIALMVSDIPIVRRSGGEMALNASSEKMRRALADVTSMESISEIVRKSISETASSSGLTEREIVMQMSTQLLEFRVDEANYPDIEKAVVAILAARMIAPQN